MITPEVLNAAMASYVQTISNRTRLSEHLTQAGLEAFESEVAAELDSVLESASSRLWKDAGNIVWSSDYEHSHAEYLQQQHPWLNTESISRVMSYSQWLCWHEGLNAK